MILKQYIFWGAVSSMCLFKRHVLICLLSCFYLKESEKIMWNLNTNCITWLSATVEELVVGSIFQNANKSRLKVKFIVGRAFVVIVVNAMGNKLYFLDSDLKAKEVHFGFLGWLSCVSQDSAQLKMINNEKLIPDLYFELSTASLKPLRQKTDVRYSNV